MDIKVTYPYPDEYSDLIKALSIKNRYKRTCFIYDKACDYIDSYNENNNIRCEFCDNRCSDHRHKNNINGCCAHCKYQSNRGCKTQNLSCKFYFCDYMSKYPVIKEEDIHILKLLSKRQRYICKNNVFCKRSIFIGLLFTGSVLVYFLYCFIKDIDIIAFEIQKKLSKK